jgi:short-subunit dehydrogenase
MGGVIVNISSLATLYPLPYMPIYNAGKSALSAFTQTMMLESNSNIRWIDYRLGDVNTKFNDSAPKQDLVEQNESMKNAWCKLKNN